MINALLLKNRITHGQLTAATLNTELAASAQQGAFADICARDSWIRGCLMSPGGRAAIFGSANALPILFSSGVAKRIMWDSQTIFNVLAATAAAVTYVKSIAGLSSFTSPLNAVGRVLLVEYYSGNSGTLSASNALSQGAVPVTLSYSCTTTRKTAFTRYESPVFSSSGYSGNFVITTITMDR